MIAKCKIRYRQMHATFLKQNDFYTPCARWYVFLFSINFTRQAISDSLSWALPFCSRKPAMYLTASLRWHRQADENIDQCVTASGSPDILFIMLLYYTNCQSQKREIIQPYIYKILHKVDQVIYTLDTICVPIIMILA